MENNDIITSTDQVRRSGYKEGYIHDLWEAAGIGNPFVEKED